MTDVQFFGILLIIVAITILIWWLLDNPYEEE